jgi:hypothetical protein
MRNENQRGVLEYDAAEAAPRERDSKDHAEFHTLCVPHPAVVAGAKRFIQQVGAVAVVFRYMDNMSSETWFRDVARANRVPHALPAEGRFDSRPRPRITQGYWEQDVAIPTFCLVRSSTGLLVVVTIRGGGAAKKVDPQFLPSTMEWLWLASYPIASAEFDFAALAESCPRLVCLHLSSCGLNMELKPSLTAVLAKYPLLQVCDLHCNDLKSNSGLDLSEVSENLAFLTLSDNKRLAGDVVGKRPAQFAVSGTALKTRDQ